ncbi:MAG: hypothetical protein K5644_09735 [Lachnospiraceae bacterium]|nr:hypothetical protein [Lachnospiraceae bacterium]
MKQVIAKMTNHLNSDSKEIKGGLKLSREDLEKIMRFVEQNEAQKKKTNRNKEA